MFDREQRIRDRAYAIWERDGRREGKHHEHWAQAVKEIVDEDLAAGHVMTDSAPPEPSARPARRRRKASAPAPVQEEAPTPKAAKPSNAAKTDHKEAVLDDRKVALAVEKNAEDTESEASGSAPAEPAPKKAATARRTVPQVMAAPVVRGKTQAAQAPLTAPPDMVAATPAPAPKQRAALPRSAAASTHSKASKAVWSPSDIKHRPEPTQRRRGGKE